MVGVVSIVLVPFVKLWSEFVKFWSELVSIWVELVFSEGLDDDKRLTRHVSIDWNVIDVGFWLVGFDFLAVAVWWGIVSHSGRLFNIFLDENWLSVDSLWSESSL